MFPSLERASDFVLAPFPQRGPTDGAALEKAAKCLEGGWFVMQPRYVTLERGQLQGRLQPGCWLKGADNQQQQQQH